MTSTASSVPTSWTACAATPSASTPGVEIASDQVTSVDLTRRPFRLVAEDGEYTCDALIIATGASAAKYLGLRFGDRTPRPRRFRMRHLRWLLLPRPARSRSIGGGNTAVEEALYLSNIAEHVTLVHRRDKLRAEAILQDRLFELADQAGKVSFVWNHAVEEVLGNESRASPACAPGVDAGWQRSARSTVTGVFIAIGHAPNTELFEGQLDMKDGYLIQVKSGLSSGNATATSVPGVFAAGDVADSRLPPGGHLGRHRVHGSARRRSNTWSASQPPDPDVDARIIRFLAEVGARRVECAARRRGAVPAPRIPVRARIDRLRRRPPRAGMPGTCCCARRMAPSRARCPCTCKSHSWGEFVFDFAWAEAYHRAGLRYYPRLVSAIPFTPATGPRILASGAPARTALIDAARALCASEQVSSLHVLFPRPGDRETLEALGWMPRLDCQFHWRNEGYAAFDDFLAGFTAEKRKKLRRERRRVGESGIACRTLGGADLDEGLIDVIYGLHASTFVRHGHYPYLNRAFFAELARTMPESLVVELASVGGVPVACAIMLRGADTLFGRYWGASGDFHSLHFELCYYRGIEYCIREGLARFEPGTQGEHKLLRGFLPTPVWSMHEIADPRFAAAIGEWLARERAARRGWLREAATHLPFRRADIPARLEADVRNRLASED